MHGSGDEPARRLYQETLWSNSNSGTGSGALRSKVGACSASLKGGSRAGASGGGVAGNSKWLRVSRHQAKVRWTFAPANGQAMDGLPRAPKRSRIAQRRVCATLAGSVMNAIRVSSLPHCGQANGNAS